MNGTNEDKDRHRTRRELVEDISEKEQRKIRARQEEHRTVWFGLGMFGLVGWSVAVPALIGIALGLWIDAKWPSRFSWTLMLLVLGVALGCITAWRWVVRESVENEESS